MVVNNMIQLFRMIGQGMAVYLFQDRIGTPTAALHDIGIRYTVGMLDRCAVVPKIMESETW